MVREGGKDAAAAAAAFFLSSRVEDKEVFYRAASGTIYSTPTIS